MDLLKYRIKNFRAIVNSGWIECHPVTAFVGANESGKTTLLMALMKLMDHKQLHESADSVFKSNVGKLCKINQSEDVPFGTSDEVKRKILKEPFIEAVFDITGDMRERLKEIGGGEVDPGETLMITKTLGGVYDLPELLPRLSGSVRDKALKFVLLHMPTFLYFKEVTEIKSEINFVELAYKLSGIRRVKNLTPRESLFANLLNYLDIWQSNLVKSIEQIYGDLKKTPEKTISFIEIFEKIPMFKDRFTRGCSALTSEFRKWWGNDEIIIDYEVYKKGVRLKFTGMDGKPFQLENRSTGFRRFFALFLSFAVAAKSDFENAILLFDEAGAALHPLMQRKLAYLFGDMGDKTQILYNTHSSYMLPVTEMNRAHIIYKDINGHVNITTSMQLFPNRTNEESLYVAQASLAMHLAESALIGCWPIVVLDKEDMYYLQIIKDVMVAKGKLNTIYETLIFSAGDGGIDTIAELYGGNGFLPVVLLSSDWKSRAVKQRLIDGIYKNYPEKIYEVSDFDGDAVTMEDLIPPKFWELFAADHLRSLLGPGFEYDSEQPVLKQIEEYAFKQDVILSSKYRSELARAFKLCVMEKYHDPRIPFFTKRKWLRMLRTLLKDSGPAPVDAIDEAARQNTLEWKPEYTIGYALIDDEHRKLFDMLNKFGDAIDEGSGSSVIKEALDFISHYVIKHFHDEEELMQNIEYPEYERHKLLHDNFRTTVTILVQKYETQGSTYGVCSEIHRVMMKWLLLHVGREDCLIGEYIRENDLLLDFDDGLEEAAATEGAKSARFAGSDEPVELFTLSRYDVFDYLEMIDSEAPYRAGVKEKETDALPDMLLCGNTVFGLMYERNEVIFNISLRLSKESAGRCAAKHNIQSASSPTGGDWYEIVIDSSFPYKKAVYRLIEESYLYTLKDCLEKEVAALKAAEEAAVVQEAARAVDEAAAAERALKAAEEAARAAREAAVAEAAARKAEEAARVAEDRKEAEAAEAAAEEAARAAEAALKAAAVAEMAAEEAAKAEAAEEEASNVAKLAKSEKAAEVAKAVRHAAAEAERKIIEEQAGASAGRAAKKAEEAENNYLAALAAFRSKYATSFTVTRKQISRDTRGLKNPDIYVVERPEKLYLPTSLRYKERTYAMLYMNYRRGENMKDSCVRATLMLSHEYAEKLALTRPEVCRARFPKGPNWYYVPVEGSFEDKADFYKALDAARACVDERLLLPKPARKRAKNNRPQE